jgi:hypothetical protein
MYEILPYTMKQAKKLNVIVKPSTRKNKKIDVYTIDGDYICSVGALGYKDYPTYIKLNGKEYAEKRRYLYKLRHKKDLNIIGSKGFYADKLLW